MIIYTVQIEVASEDDTIWQALEPAKNEPDGLASGWEPSDPAYEWVEDLILEARELARRHD